MLFDHSIPDGYVVYPHQVAGHRFEEGRRGMLIDKDGKLLKPLQEPPRGERELHFYENVFSKDVSDAVTLKLKSFLPTFYGIKVVTHSDFSARKDIHYLKLEDLTRHFSKPCVMDIKIGQSIVDHLATQAKRERGKLKYPEQELFGFRIIGMKVYKKDLTQFKCYDKSFGKKLKTKQEVMAGFQEFFCMEDHGKEHILRILEQCKVIKSWFQEQRKFRLFSSSILLVYEGDPARMTVKDLVECNGLQKMSQYSSCAEMLDGLHCCVDKKCINCLQTQNNYYRTFSITKDQEHGLKTPPVTVHLVDFAHSYIGSYSEPDKNYLYGLQNLIHCLEELVT